MHIHRTLVILLILCSTLVACQPFTHAADQLPQTVLPNEATGIASAVRVGDWPLVHTPQILPVDAKGNLTAEDAAGQTTQLFSQLRDMLAETGSEWNRLVKLNVYAADAAAARIMSDALRRSFEETKHQFAVTFVITSLPLAGTHLAIDAVATTTMGPERSVNLIATGSGVSNAAIIPDGTRIYISGQAEAADSLREATQKTLESLRNTLKFLGRGDQDIVQLKAFLMPMTEAETVRSEVRKFFGDRPMPPLVLVEWKSGQRVPIEIELIAWGSRNRTGPIVEYLTPPEMKPSPVFSRIARINHAASLYISGLNGKPGDDPSGETEVRSVFASLQTILKSGGSDLKHLAKATYYVSTDEASAKLNALRPEFYDPQRPPAASKAVVSTMPQSGIGLTLDMIAVPAVTNAIEEYGPVEVGFGLTPEKAAAGWISLFDGKSTLGWRESEVAVGSFETKTRFGDCELQADFISGGKLFLGDRAIDVPAGKFSLPSTLKKGATTIRLGPDVRMRHLAVKPRGLKTLFNGKDLTGWKRLDHPRRSAEDPTKWEINNNGALRGIGGPGCMEFQEEQFGDFVLQLDVRTNVRHANGGVFFRAIPGDFMNGYEAQVFNRANDSHPATPAFWSTGGLDDFQNARRLVSRDGHYFRMTVIADGPHISTWINGFQQVDFLDEREPDENPRKGKRTAAGVIQLQAHDAETDVEFRRINALKW